MRLLLGMILGVMLTVGAAYVRDSTTSTDLAGVPAIERPMVNWDVVGENWRQLSAKVRDQISKLTT